MTTIAGPFFHGTKVEFAPGDLIVPGYRSNYGAGLAARWVYVSARVDIAVLAAELATNGARARVFVVEPLGPLEDDPNVTDKKFPGNPTLSYRCQHHLRVVEEVEGWAPTPPDRLRRMQAMVERMRRDGIEAIE
ncbi:NAD(+)--rifampin ADP-ribosyltransferase [Tabrizicola sp. BL-A-41-H6]|uniref:NAD(+)--rifampin ADP-ribosyltransferase n=1 Tax=Tabrizicola sp. BL-A-41-H6 TaxID=3421107 RepID=UPI003D673EA6